MIRMSEVAPLAFIGALIGALAAGCGGGAAATPPVPAPAPPSVTAQTPPKYSPVRNVQLVGATVDRNYRTIRFDVSWANSWRNTVNYDAMWVFAKYRIGASTWKHATLMSPTAAFLTGSAGGAAAFTHAGDRKGVFLHRSGTGEGSFSSEGVEVPWDVQTDGVTGNDVAEVRVFAIEMVQVPGGSFYVGDGTPGTGDPGNVFQGQLRKAQSNTPFQVSSEDAIALGGTAIGNLTSSGGSTPPDDFTPATTQLLPAAYPKGFRAFWTMKHELTQGQYVDFLNTLTYAQQAGATSQLTATPQYASVAPSSPTGTKAIVTSQGNSNFRNFVEIATPGESPGKPAVYGVDFDEDNVFDEATDGGTIACGYLTWLDGTAYADWAGLRPMSQLEYEKATRGPALPVPNEFAWGDNTFTPATGVVNPGTLQEAAANSNANVSATNLIPGPVRTGMFQGTGKTRSQSGASYYGILDMSGNVWERVASLGRSEGRSFVGNHGDGEISADGKANVSGWPGSVGGVVANGLGTGFIGGNFFRTEDFNGVFFNYALLRTSGRLYGNTEDTVRFSGNGFRAVRTHDD